MTAHYLIKVITFINDVKSIWARDNGIQSTPSAEQSIATNDSRQHTIFSRFYGKVILSKRCVGDSKYFSAKVTRSHECMRAKGSYLKSRGEGVWSCESGMDHKGNLKVSLFLLLKTYQSHIINLIITQSEITFLQTQCLLKIHNFFLKNSSTYINLGTFVSVIKITLVLFF